MALVIEDGTNIPGANSYATVAELTEYAAARKITLPTEDEDKEVLLVKAMDYLNTLAMRWRGYPTFDDQALAWPRTYARKDLGVPADLKTAQIIAAIAAQTIDLMPVQSGTQRNATRKTVGPITVQYQNTGSSYGVPRIPQLDAILRPMFAGGLGSVPVVRA